VVAVTEINAMKSLHRSDLRRTNEIPYFEIPEIAHLGWVRHAFLTRMGGTSPSPFESLNLGKDSGDSEDHVSRNKRLAASSFGFDPHQFILLHQVHEDRILVLRKPDDHLPAGLEYDAMITHAPNRFLGIKTADCLPILILDTSKKVVAGVHAGRQGTAYQITRKVLRKMKTEWGCLPGDLWVAVGPSIGPCCYEIDEKVFLQEWKSFSRSKGAGKWMVDLPGINMAQMEMEGIREDQIFRINLCTRCHPDLFFSYRGEGQTGRQLSFIGIAEANPGCRSL
jgi:polyphenol oxidase